MSVDLSAVFNKLNTNTQGESANILDQEEVQSAKQNGCIFTVEEGMTSETFTQANESSSGKVSVFDTDANQNVSVKEQKATILDKLKNVWDNAIARFFKDDIDYNDSNAQSVDKQVQTRQQNAINYLEYAEENNVKGVFYKEGELHEYKDNKGNTYFSGNNPKATGGHVNDNGTMTHTYANGQTITWREDNCLKLSSNWKENNYWNINDSYKYNEDGSYTYHKEYNNGEQYNSRYNQNNIMTNTYKITARGSIKVVPAEGTTFDDALNQLGITDESVRQAIKKANPKANKAGKFTNGNDLYIPANIVQKLDLDENKLLNLGVVSQT